MGKTNIQALHRKFANKIKAKNPQLADQLATANYDWYRLKNSTKDTDTYDLYIYDEIMPAWMVEWVGSGVSAEGLIAELEEISANTINVRINSPGGAVFEALAIYSALVTHSATINVYVDALAASAASIIAMAGDTVTMMVGSQLMIHDAMGMEMGNAAAMREFAKFLDKQSDNLASVYAARNGMEVSEMRSLMLAETWMNAAEAVEMGLADAIYSKPKNAPEQQDPDQEEEPDPEDPNEGGETEGETDPENKADADDTDAVDDVDQELEDIMSRMHRRHSLVNRGFKFAGRDKAPSPLDMEVDEILNALGRK